LKYLSFGCAHIHDDSRLKINNQLQEVIRQEAPDILILNGDFDDPCEVAKRTIKLTQTYQSWQRLFTERSKLRLSTFRIRGNHDNNPDPEPNVVLMSNLIIEYPVNVEFRHGHEFDWVWTGNAWFPGIDWAVFWLLDRCPRLIWEINSLKHCFSRWWSPRDRKKGSTEEDYSKRVGKIHDRARNYAIRKDRTIIMGHTHCPYQDNFITDMGDMEDSFSYVVIEKGKIEVRYLKEEVEK